MMQLCLSGDSFGELKKGDGLFGSRPSVSAQGDKHLGLEEWKYLV